MQTCYGPELDGAGAPCVTWVLDERGVVGDNISDWVSPVVGARSRQCSKAVQHGCWRARRLQELTARPLMCWWAVPTVDPRPVGGQGIA